MIWIGFSIMWLSVAGVVIFTVMKTGRLEPLWLMIIPALIRVREEEKKDSDSTTDGGSKDDA